MWAVVLFGAAIILLGRGREMAVAMDGAEGRALFLRCHIDIAYASFWCGCNNAYRRVSAGALHGNALTEAISPEARGGGGKMQ